MPNLTPNFNFNELVQGDTVQAAVAGLNSNTLALDGYAHITGSDLISQPDGSGEGGWHWLRFTSPEGNTGTCGEYVMLWGNFAYTAGQYNTRYQIGNGPEYKSINPPTDVTGLVSQAFPTFAKLTEVQALILNGGGNPDGTLSTAGYPHFETEAVLYGYTESNGAKTGIQFYWTCPRQESGVADIWAKVANIIVIGRL